VSECAASVSVYCCHLSSRFLGHCHMEIYLGRKTNTFFKKIQCMLLRNPNFQENYVIIGLGPFLKNENSTTKLSRSSDFQSALLELCDRTFGQLTMGWRWRVQCTKIYTEAEFKRPLLREVQKSTLSQVY